MISKARVISRRAGYGELGPFALISMSVVVLLASSGYGALKAVPELLGSRPELSWTYVSKLADVLFPAVIWVVACGFASLNYRTLTNTVARCELAEDEMAWINHHPEYEQMVEDRGLMRLAANVGRVCRTRTAADGLLVRFLGEYRKLLEDYGSGMEGTPEARIQDMNEAADEDLERYARRKARENMRHKKEEDQR